MFDKDRWQEIFIAIKQNKLRSALTAFGVFWGILMLVVMSGSSNGLVNGITHGMRSFATNSAFIWTDVTNKPYKGFQQGRRWNFTNEDVEMIKEQIPEIDVVAPRLRGWRSSSGHNVHRGTNSGTFNINGDYPEYNRIDPSEMIYGRFINQIDINNRRKVCIIGERVYEVLFDEGENPIGEYIKAGGLYYQVIGVFKPTNPNIQMDGNKSENIYIPFSTMQRVYNYGNTVHYMGITVKDGYDVGDVTERVMSLIKRNNFIAPDDDAMGHVNVQELVRSMNYMFIGISVLIWIVGIGTLIAGAVGISNIMLVVVRERTKEIGIQRAIGARPRTIVSQILTESVFLTTIAGFLGLAFGTLVIHFADLFITHINSQRPPDEFIFIRDPQVGLGIALAALVMLVVTGLIAGFIPARKAVRVKPIDAIRHE
ncbi:ABC transporter permease [Marinilabiliaceae bacterium ANBcel2]|nr:ABC transporter permease [Marinilabiliaceae bacterium ANBcel2]